MFLQVIVDASTFYSDTTEQITAHPTVSKAVRKRLPKAASFPCPTNLFPQKIPAERQQLVCNLHKLLCHFPTCLTGRDEDQADVIALNAHT